MSRMEEIERLRKSGLLTGGDVNEKLRVEIVGGTGGVCVWLAGIVLMLFVIAWDIEALIAVLQQIAEKMP